MTHIEYKFKVKELELVVDALEYKAYSEAGQSQKPHLFTKEETDEWKLAQEIKKEMSGYAG